jgi:hypothetical protein
LSSVACATAAAQTLMAGGIFSFGIHQQLSAEVKENTFLIWGV